MFTTELSYVLEAAFRESIKRRHEFFCVEHILFALSFDKGVEEILTACGASSSTLREDLETFFKSHLDIAPLSEGEPAQTPAVQRVLQRAVFHAQSAQKDQVSTKDVFVAIYGEEDSHAVASLLKQKVSKLDVLDFISHGITKNAEDDQGSEGISAEEDDENPSQRSQKPVAWLARCADDLTDLARKDKLDPVIGRDAELAQMLRILCRRQKNNPLLIGEAGVGKTALANALAQRLIKPGAPEQLKDAQVFSLNIAALIAGTKFRGEFEERIRSVLNELKKIPKAILFIDEIHTIVGAGATGSGSMDVANLLKPALATGALRCIGSTTRDDYKKSIEKDRALVRRFSPITIEEPSEKDAVAILKGLKNHFETFHSVTFSARALEAAVSLSKKHINDRFLPDKAIDVIDEAGAANALLNSKERKSSLGEREIEQVVSQMARVPVKRVSKDDEQVLRSLELNLKQVLFGQDNAITSVVRAVKRNRASIRTESRPVGAFLFAGPTGVGKTELAKSLAHELGIPFLRFDMSEYMEKHSVARLVGAPPGYVGYEEGGQLVEKIRANPSAVLLLDEIEKAHEDVYNILLQVMDAAVLTDSHGKKADFRNVILIMTSNVGSEKASSLGFGQAASTSHREEAVKRQFKPEFRNRLDEIVYFQPLPEGIVVGIVDKFIKELEQQLAEKKVTLTLTDSARKRLAVLGFDAQLGARPMARVVQREIKDRIVDDLLFGTLKDGGAVHVDCDKDNNLVVTSKSRGQKPKNSGSKSGTASEKVKA